LVSNRNSKVGLRILGLAAALAAAFTLSANAFASQGRGKCDDCLAHQLLTSKSARVSVIIRIAGKSSKVYETRLAALGGDVYRHLPIINSLALSLPSKNVSRLLRLSFVRHLSLDERVEKTDLFTVPSSRADTACSSMELTAAKWG